MAVGQINIFQLTHCYREQAPSHKKQKKQICRVCKTRP